MTATDLHLRYKADTANPYPEQELTNCRSEEIREYVEWLEERIIILTTKAGTDRAASVSKVETSIEICRLALGAIEKTLKDK